MAYARKKIDRLEALVSNNRKKFVRYDEGAELYSMGQHFFEQLAKEAGAIYRIKRIVLVNMEVVEAYLENFREVNN